MSSFKNFAPMLTSLQAQADGTGTIAGSPLEDFLSIAGYGDGGGGGGGEYDAYDFVISQVDSGTPVLEKGTWQGVYDALQNMEHVTGLYLKNLTPGEYHDTRSIVLPLTNVNYYSSADSLQAWAPYYNGGGRGIAIGWPSDGTISVTDAAL